MMVPSKPTTYTLIAAAVMASLGLFLFSAVPGTGRVGDALRLDVNGKDLDFAFTDDNEGETLIIRTDQKQYSGFAGADVYVSVTNTATLEEDVALLFYFSGDEWDVPQGTSSPEVLSMQKMDDNKWGFLRFWKNNITLSVTPTSSALQKRESFPDDLIAKAATRFALAPGETAYLKARIQYPPGSKGEFWIEGVGHNGGYGLLDPWYGSDWSYRRRITIDHNKVSGTSDLSNFAVLVSVTDPSFRHTSFGGKVASASSGITGGGGDFVFSDSDGTTQLDHEIEKYASSSGELWAWVRVPTLSATTDTTLYIYYSGPSSGPTNQNPSGVWDSNYKGVWHLKEVVTDETTVPDVHRDSTSNANHGDQDENDDTTGKLNGAQSFDGTDDSITIPDDNNSLDFGSGQGFTVSGWVRYSGPNATQTIARFHVNTWIVERRSTGVLRFQIVSGTTDFTDGTSNLNDGRFHYFVARRTGGTGTMDLFIDGQAEGTPDTNNNSVAAAGSLRLGKTSIDTEFFNGTLDEVRVSNTARPNDWISTEYNNQISPALFAYLGGEEVEVRAEPSVQFRGGIQIRGGVDIR